MDMSVTVGADKSREYFVTRAEADKILDACPNAEWRAIFSLCPYGGLRCPSEVLDIRWEDIAWNQNRIILRSRKTAHHEGNERRVIPNFPDLIQPLGEADELAPEGAIHVVTQYRCQNSNLRTQFKRIVKRAGLVP